MRHFPAFYQPLLLTVLVIAQSPLSADVRIKITVVADSKGVPIPDAQLFAVKVTKGKQARYRSPSPTGKQGEYEVDLAPGDYKIVVCDGSFAPGAKEIKIGPSEMSREEEIRLKEIEAHTELSGQTLVKKKPKPNLKIAIQYDDPGVACLSKVFDATSDDKGNYLIERLPTQKGLNYHVSLSDPKDPFSGTKVEVHDLASPNVKMNLDLGRKDSEVAFGGTAANTPPVGGRNGYRTTVSSVPSIEATYTHRVFVARRLQVNLELPFVIRPSVTVTSDIITVARSYRALFFTPSARVTVFAHRRIFPWISLGSGLAHFMPSSLNQVFLPSGASSSSKLAFQAGAGVDFWPSHHFGLRTQIRNFYSGGPALGVPEINLRNNLFVGGGILIRR